MINTEAMFPVMVIPSLESVKAFYETIFGFESVFYDPNFYLHLALPTTGVQLGFLLENHHSQPDFLNPTMSTDGYVISLEVKEANQAYLEAKSLNLTIVMPLKEEEWVQIHFIIQDPSGIHIDIVQHL